MAIAVDADWCALAEASLSVELTKSRLHLVNTLVMCIDERYSASVKGPFVTLL